MTRQIFRKAALTRLASPDQLDQLMQVTSPRSWIALAGFALGTATSASNKQVSSGHVTVSVQSKTTAKPIPVKKPKMVPEKTPKTPVKKKP